MKHNTAILALGLTITLIRSSFAQNTASPFSSVLISDVQNWLNLQIEDDQAMLVYYESTGFGSEEESTTVSTQMFNDTETLGFLKALPNISNQTVLQQNAKIQSFADFTAPFNPKNHTLSNLQAVLNQYYLLDSQQYANWESLENYDSEIPIVNNTLQRFSAQNQGDASLVSSFLSGLPQLETQLNQDKEVFWSNWKTEQKLYVRDIEEYALGTLKQLHSDMEMGSNNITTINAKMNYTSGLIQKLLSNRSRSDKEDAQLNEDLGELDRLNKQLYAIGNGRYGLLFSEAVTVEDIYLCLHDTCETKTESEEESNETSGEAASEKTGETTV